MFRASYRNPLSRARSALAAVQASDRIDRIDRIGPPLTPSAQGERVLLLGVGFGPPSRRALRRAAALATELGYKLRLVHATSEEPSTVRSADASAPPPHGTEITEITDPTGTTEATELRELSDWTERMQAIVQAWAALLAGVVVPTSQICVASGDSLKVLMQEAARPEVALVILGRSERSDAALHDSLPHRLLRVCQRPLLVVGARGLQPVIVAATDCADERLPVLRGAASLVPALGEKVVAVHNLDSEASRLTAHLGSPLLPRVAAVLSTHMQEWIEESGGQNELLITNHPETAEGVLATAQSKMADLLVVGVKPHKNASQNRSEEPGEGTAELLLQRCHISILFVPVGTPSAVRPSTRDPLSVAPLQGLP